MDDRSQRHQKQQKPANTRNKTESSGSNKSNPNNNTTTARASIFGHGTNDNNNNKNNKHANLINKAARFFSVGNSMRSDEQESQASNIGSTNPIMNKLQSLNPGSSFSLPRNIMSRHDRAAARQSSLEEDHNAFYEHKQQLQSQKAAIEAEMAKLENKINSFQTSVINPTQKGYFAAVVPSKGLERVQIIHQRTGKLESIIENIN